MKTLNQHLLRVAAVALVVFGAGSALADDQNAEKSAAAAGGSQSSVVVTNTAAQAVPTKDQNNFGYQPFAWRASFQLNAGSGLIALPSPAAVPVGKRLVIDTISISAGGTSTGGGTAVIAIVGGQCGGQFASLYIPGTQLGASRWVTTVSATACVDQSQSLGVQIARTEDALGQLLGQVNGTAVVIGHFVDVP